MAQAEYDLAQENVASSDTLYWAMEVIPLASCTSASVLAMKASNLRSKKTSSTRPTSSIRVLPLDSAAPRAAALATGLRQADRVRSPGASRLLRLVADEDGLGSAHLFFQLVAPSVIPLARERLRLKRGEWHTLRVAFKGPEAVAQIAGVTAKGSHPVLGQPKEQMNLLVFGRCRFRKLIVVR